MISYEAAFKIGYGDRAVPASNNKSIDEQIFDSLPFLTEESEDSIHRH